MINTMPFDLENEALIASGLKDEGERAAYRQKLDELQAGFIDQMGKAVDPIERAAKLFHWLWKDRPDRYQRHGPFLLNRVIDAQISAKSQPVGNCLGLTLLYNCLLNRLGVKTSALYLERAYDLGPHVLTLLIGYDPLIEVENIFSTGFDYKGHLDNTGRVQWGARELAGDIYHSLGNESFEKERFREALVNYEKALELNPDYEKAHLNKAIVLDKMQREK
ncbi:tetratricopeptide repeat protein [Thermodesulfobacteriota bacterium]